jgi:hypothetical protein
MEDKSGSNKIFLFNYMIKKTILVNKLNFYKNKRSIQKKNVYQKEKNYKIQLSNNSMLSDKIFLKKQITHVHF